MAEPSILATDRRTFMKQAGVAAGITAAAGLVSAGTASAATSKPADATGGEDAGVGTGLPTFAPIPKEAFGPALNADGYFVGRIDGNLYWVTDSFYNSMFLSTPEGVVIVDAPPTIGHNLLRAIADATGANGMPGKVTHLVYSHSHADHAGASSILGNDVVRIGHSETRRLLLRDNDPNRPAPNVTFDDRYTLEVGGERLELAYHGPNHSPDNIYIHAPEHKTLMLGGRDLPGLGPVQEPSRLAGHPRLVAGPGNRDALPVDDPGRWARGPARRSVPDGQDRTHQ
jgi:glyoxylase-like metal-dependent hydrolase (beta-lactamase superfamily II)